VDLDWKDVGLLSETYMRTVIQEDGSIQLHNTFERPPFPVYYGEHLEVGDNETWTVSSNLFTPPEGYVYPIRRISREEAERFGQKRIYKYELQDFDVFRLGNEIIRVENPNETTRTTLKYLWDNRREFPNGLPGTQICEAVGAIGDIRDIFGKSGGLRSRILGTIIEKIGGNRNKTYRFNPHASPVSARTSKT
jgi:hypothetical protein